MIEVCLIQGSPCWHKYRMDHLGSSDIAAVLGLSPWKTRHELWSEKVGLTKNEKKTYAMQRGNDLEPVVRDMLEEECGLVLKPKVFASKRFPFMSCSVDAIDSKHELVYEIKCPGAVDHAKAVKGSIPEKYVPQLQHILAVLDLGEIYYTSFDGTSTVTIKVPRDEEFIKDMIEQEKAFWTCVENLCEPEITKEHPRHIKKKEYIERTDEQCAQLALRYKYLDQQINQLSTEKDQVKKSLVIVGNDMSFKCQGITVAKVERKGLVDYSAIPVLRSLDLEQYRKPSSTNWVVTL